MIERTGISSSARIQKPLLNRAINHVTRCTVLLGWLSLATGCAGIAEGVTSALLGQAEEEDTRACHIKGPASLGLEAKLRQQEHEREKKNQTARTLKVIMVHGIGRHLPGYSGRLQENLIRALKLDVADELVKRVRIRLPQSPEKSLGVLQIHRYLNKARTREVLFYELTWSDITEPAKEALAFDDSGEHAFRRAGINKMMKSFFNSHVPELLIYVGNARRDIQTSVQQSFCWATTGDWQDLPKETAAWCDLTDSRRAKYMREDDYAIITHSLGSRIVVDMIQEIGNALTEDKDLRNFQDAVRNKRVPIYMLANQLPLLQLGREPISIRDKVAEYCRPAGRLYSQRAIGELAIYAFSDPNDILSYAIPPRFVEESIDSRLCPRVTNIVLNVAKPISLFGISDFANPIEAHTGYDNDSRVIGIITRGSGHDDVSPVVKNRCTVTETTRGKPSQLSHILP